MPRFKARFRNCFKDRFKDRFKARYNKIPGCGVSWIGNFDLERFDCCDRGGVRSLEGCGFAGGSFAECVFCGIANFTESEACWKDTRAMLLWQERRKAQKVSGSPQKPQSKLEHPKLTEQAEAQKKHRANWSTQMLKSEREHTKAQKNKWST